MRMARSTGEVAASEAATPAGEGVPGKKALGGIEDRTRCRKFEILLRPRRSPVHRKCKTRGPRER
jgi:hypothetical protein